MKMKTETMNALIETYLNGNIKDARKGFKRTSAREIREGFFETCYSFKKAALTAKFLKTGEGYQEACDAD